MPLLGKKLYKPNSIPKDLKAEEEVFVIKETNEVFRSYEYPFVICESARCKLIVHFASALAARSLSAVLSVQACCRSLDSVIGTN